MSRHFSYSELRDFKTCPKLHGLKYAERRPIAPEREKKAFVGTILGSVIEQFYKERWWREPATVLQRMEDYALERARGRTERKRIDWLPSEWDAMWKLVCDTLPKILTVIKRERLLGARNEVEHESFILLTDAAGVEHTIHGRIDILIFLPNGDLILLDAKAGGSKGKFVHTDQLRIYCLMVKREFGQYPKRVGFWWLRHEEIIWKRMTATTLATFEEGVSKTITQIVAGTTSPAPGTHCRYCDFFFECDEGRKHLFDKEGAKCPMDIPGGVTIGSF